MRVTLCLTTLIVAACSCSVAIANSVPAIDFDPGTDVASQPGPGQFPGWDFYHVDGTWGWCFYVVADSEPVTITDVAWFDENGDGLSHNHMIGIWREDGWPNYELLGAEVVPSGTEAPLDGPWRRVPFGPITIKESGNYYIGGLDQLDSTDAVKFVDSYELNSSGESLQDRADPRIGIVGPAGNHDGFGPPGFVVLSTGAAIGPMFYVESVPEPNGIWMSVCFAGAFFLAFIAREMPRRNASLDGSTIYNRARRETSGRKRPGPDLYCRKLQKRKPPTK